mmetsp:Transcript_18251/g.36738  ORF Transcript_18251/g.36738 Transcript_18251/m.36738 type:complete len:366 (-) Transcript_18251:1575-2672(-)
MSCLNLGVLRTEADGILADLRTQCFEVPQGSSSSPKIALISSAVKVRASSFFRRVASSGSTTWYCGSRTLDLTVRDSVQSVSTPSLFVRSTTLHSSETLRFFFFFSERTNSELSGASARLLRLPILTFSEMGMWISAISNSSHRKSGSTAGSGFFSGRCSESTWVSNFLFFFLGRATEGFSTPSMCRANCITSSSSVSESETLLFAAFFTHSSSWIQSATANPRRLFLDFFFFLTSTGSSTCGTSDTPVGSATWLTAVTSVLADGTKASVWLDPASPEASPTKFSPFIGFSASSSICRSLFVFGSSKGWLGDLTSAVAWLLGSAAVAGVGTLPEASSKISFPPLKRRHFSFRRLIHSQSPSSYSK